MNIDLVGATVFFGGVAYVVVIFGYFIVWPQPLLPVASISDLAPESEQ